MHILLFYFFNVKLLNVLHVWIIILLFRFQATAAAEDYKELSNSIIESLKELLNPLLNIKTSQIQYLCRNFHFDFPDYEYIPNDGNLQFDNNLLNSWKAIGEKVKNVDDILKKIYSTFNQNLTEVIYGLFSFDSNGTLGNIIKGMKYPLRIFWKIFMQALYSSEILFISIV